MDYKKIADLNELELKENNYPGRGVIIGKTLDEKNYVQIYWIMGRSNNSRNRVFELESNFVKTKAHDESKMEDPSLIIYYPVKSVNGYHIVSNGDQTDTIYDNIKNGRTFEDALNTREFEPDAPNYTPRISGIINLNTENAGYSLSILKTIENDPEYCIRNYYNYNNFINGFGHCIHTYKNDGTPIPSFKGEPYLVTLYNDIEDNLKHYWNILNSENRISLLVKYIDAESQRESFRIINKNR